MVMNLNAFVQIQREVIRSTFVDTCKIYPAGGEGTVSDRGVYVETTPSAPRVYEGSSDIPCHVDIARPFFKDRVEFQANVTDNYYIFLPVDVEVLDTDEIVWNSRRFEIRKIVLAGNMAGSIEVLVSDSSKA